MDDYRVEELTEYLQEVVHDGEYFTVRKTSSVLRILDPGSAEPSLSEDHPSLHGRLLAINERLDASGGNLGLFTVLAIVFSCVALEMSWVDSLWGLELDQLQSFWVYLIIAIAGFLISSFLSNPSIW